jgi:hypothetical protein
MYSERDHAQESNKEDAVLDTGCSIHPLASQFPVEIRLKFLNQRTFIPRILHHRQCMPGASATTREM